MLFISEFVSLAQDGRGGCVAIPQAPAKAEHALSLSQARAKDVRLDPATRFVLLHTDEACRFGLGREPGPRLAPGESRLYSVSGGMFISAIASD